MYVLAGCVAVWLRSGTFLVPASDLVTRLGRLTMAGEVVDAVPIVPKPMRVMDEWIISLVYRGSGSYRYGDGRVEPIEPGTLTIVPPQVPHWYGTDRLERWSEVFAVVDGPLFSMLGEVGVLPGPGPRRLASTPPGREPASAAQALRTIIRAAPRTREQAEHQLIAMTDWLIDAVRTVDDRRPGEPSGPIAGAAQELAADLTGELSMHDVAKRVGLPYDAFRRRFRTEMGSPPAQFRNVRRLQAAADLLRFTTMNVRDIAERLGYTDEFHLSRRFKQHFGVSPSRYRQLA